MLCPGECCPPAGLAMCCLASSSRSITWMVLEASWAHLTWRRLSGIAVLPKPHGHQHRLICCCTLRLPRVLPLAWWMGAINTWGIISELDGRDVVVMSMACGHLAAVAALSSAVFAKATSGMLQHCNSFTHGSNWAAISRGEKGTISYRRVMRLFALYQTSQ